MLDIATISFHDKAFSRSAAENICSDLCYGESIECTDVVHGAYELRRWRCFIIATKEAIDCCVKQGDLPEFYCILPSVVSRDHKTRDWDIPSGHWSTNMSVTTRVRVVSWNSCFGGMSEAPSNLDTITGQLKT